MPKWPPCFAKCSQQRSQGHTNISANLSKATHKLIELFCVPSPTEPHSPANFYWTQSHAIGGNERRTPLPHSQFQQQQPQQESPRQDARIGTNLQQNTLAPSATHRPSLPVAKAQQQQQQQEEQLPPPSDPRCIVMPICPALQGPDYKPEFEAMEAGDAGVRPLSASGHPACQLCGVGIV